MTRSTALTLIAAAVTACAPSNPENSAACAITMLASGNRVLDQMQTGAKLLAFAPPGVSGTIPARVVGHGTRRALAADGPDGLVVGYEGDGFPTKPGFGLVLVEDSLDTFKGVLIYDLDPPRGIAQIGTVSDASVTLPLFGTRVTWGAVSNDRCPLFGPLPEAP